MEKKALVTGASEGIGAVFARKLAKEGFVITGVARNEEKLQSLVREIGTRHNYIVADLSTESGQKKVMSELSGAHHYDLLINNAGVGAVGKFLDIPLERQLRMLHLNCAAVVNLSHAFLKNSKSGDALINVSSPWHLCLCLPSAFIVRQRPL